MSAVWQVVRLRSVAQVNPVTRMPRKGHIDFFPMEALVEGGGLVRGHSKDASEAGGYSRFLNGDVLFAKVTPCFENRKCALAEGLERGVGLATTEVVVFRPNRRMVPEFLLYRLQAFDFQEFGLNAMRGVGGLKRVPDRMIGDFQIQLPPVPEQRRIVAFIEQELALLAERQEALERKKDVLVDAKQALREAIAFGRLRPGDARSPSDESWHGAVPSHWGTERLGNLFRESADLGHADLPVLSVSIHSGISDREMDDELGFRKVSRSEDRTIYKRVKPLDLVYNQMRAWQGGFGVASPKMKSAHIQIEIPALPPAELAARASTSAEPSAAIAERVQAARDRQFARQGKTNRELTGRETDAVCQPDAAGEALLREAGERFGWSARAHYRVLKVARTIADLAGAPMPDAAHVAEAVQYRRVFAER